MASEEILKFYDEEIAKGGSADSVIVRVVSNAIRRERETLRFMVADLHGALADIMELIRKLKVGHDAEGAAVTGEDYAVAHNLQVVAQYALFEELANYDKG